MKGCTTAGVFFCGLFFTIKTLSGSCAGGRVYSHQPKGGFYHDHSKWKEKRSGKANDSYRISGNENSYVPATVAIELNEEILERELYGKTILREGDIMEIVQFMGGGSGLKEENKEDKLVIGGHEFTSRFILGSGKFSLDLVKACVEKAGAQIITLALRRANEGGLANILDYIPERCYAYYLILQEQEHAEEAVRIAKLVQRTGLWRFCKS